MSRRKPNEYDEVDDEQLSTPDIDWGAFVDNSASAAQRQAVDDVSDDCGEWRYIGYVDDEPMVWTSASADAEAAIAAVAELVGRRHEINGAGWVPCSIGKPSAFWP